MPRLLFSALQRITRPAARGGRLRCPVPLATAGLAIIPVLGGCYSYVQASAETITPPAAVRAHLSSEGAAEVAEVLGEPRSVLEGELTGVTPEGIFLLVPAAVVQRGTRTEVLDQQLLVQHRDLVSVQRRTLDRASTAALAAAASGAAALILYRTLSGGGGGDPTPPGGGGATELAIPAAAFPRW